MSVYASTTTVSVEKSRVEIQTLLTRYGANGFGYRWDGPRNAEEVSFRFKEKWIRFLLVMPDRKDKQFTFNKPRARYSSPSARTPQQAEKAWEQACRSAWRSLVLVVKAKLEAVDHGISSFEYEFFAWTVLPNGQTVGEALMPIVDRAIASGVTPPLLLDAPKDEDVIDV